MEEDWDSVDVAPTQTITLQMDGIEWTDQGIAQLTLTTLHKLRRRLPKDLIFNALTMANQLRYTLKT